MSIPVAMDLDGKTGFFFCTDYASKGPRVVLLTGSRWTARMAAHCGITDAPFFVRQARASEPETYPNGHPWGWVYKPDDVVKDESRYLDQESLAALVASLEVAKAKVLGVAAGVAAESNSFPIA